MNLNKFGKRLRNEAAANPKKALFLGLMACVALYFWAPLVWGWMRAEKSAGNVAAKSRDFPGAGGTAVAAVSQPLVAPPSDGTQPASVAPAWNQVAEWMHNDPRTMIAPPLTRTRDPFGLPLVETVKSTTLPKAAERRRDVAAAAKGLVLTSTIISPQRRIAQINGKIYAVGQTIDAGKDKDADCVSFQLIDVQLRKAVLQCGDERVELTIPEPGTTDNIQILGAIGL